MAFREDFEIMWSVNHLLLNAWLGIQQQTRKSIDIKSTHKHTSAPSENGTKDDQRMRSRPYSHTYYANIFIEMMSNIPLYMCFYRIFVHGANCAHVPKPEPRENNWIKKKSAATAPKSNAWLSASFMWIKKNDSSNAYLRDVSWFRSHSLFAFFSYSYVYLICDAFRER